MKILTSKNDNFLYDELILILQQIKLVQGGTSLASTLRRHSKVKNYLVEKQRKKLGYLEETYFHPDGSLDNESIDGFYENKSSQNNNNIVY